MCVAVCLCDILWVSACSLCLSIPVDRCTVCVCVLCVCVLCA